MIDVNLSKQATDDLLNIADYYSSYSVRTAQRVRDDIQAVLKLLETFPDSGTVMADGTRRNVTSRYRYNVGSVRENGSVTILAIYRSQDRQPKHRTPENR